jgi:hypothetical protein
MNIFIKTSFAAIATLTFNNPASATLHPDTQVDAILVDARPCVIFSLVGVAEADPITPGPNFALSKSHPNYAELNAMLLTAKATGRKVRVSTDGTLACGIAAIDQIVVY